MAFPALTTVFDDPLIKSPQAYLGGQEIFAMCAQSAQLIPPQRVSMDDAIASDIFHEAIKAVGEDDVSVEDAYETAVQEIKNHM